METRLASPADTVPSDAELAAIRRGALFILVGFVSTVVARLVFHGATFLLDAPTINGAQGMRDPDAPDPDFMLLLPLLAVVLVAKLIEAFGKIVCLSRPAPSKSTASSPPRLNYVPIHLALACDLAAIIGILLRLFNFGRTAGPILPWIWNFDFVGLAALLPIDLFLRRLAPLLNLPSPLVGEGPGVRGTKDSIGLIARRVGVPNIPFWARINTIAVIILLVAGVRPIWWFTLMAIGRMEWRGSIIVLALVALAAIGSYVMALVKILDRKLAAPAPSGST